MLRPASIMMLLCAGVAAMQESALKQEWKAVTDAVGYSEWGVGLHGERKGQICDPKRKFGQTNSTKADLWNGCVVLFIADPHDAYTVGDLPANQQDNFQNTQHYENAWTLHGKGWLGNSLPRAPQDLNPVCYIANVSGQIVLGYEEGNGDKLLPCPGKNGAAPFTEQQILDPQADLEDMCSQCYHTVCTGNRRTRPQDCGHIREGGVDIGEQNNNDPYGELVVQATPAYHCHLTMANEGACDYIQYEQHESAREYYMNYTVLCGWEKVTDLRISYCDCTKQNGANNGCGREECLEMALAGVVCGNCGSCSTSRAYESIFYPSLEGAEGSRKYDGTCAKALVGETEPERDYNAMLCSKGLNCQNYRQDSGCEFHCARYGHLDSECPEPPSSCEVDGLDGYGVQEEGSDKCFFVPASSQTSWARAEEACQGYGGHLASVLSEAENDLVYHLYVQSGARDNQGAIWIGATDDPALAEGAEEGTFVWSDGSGEVDATFESWSNGEPNNSGGNQDCGAMWRNDLSWDDDNCNRNLYYVCAVGQSTPGTRRRRLMSAEATAPVVVDLDTVFTFSDVVHDRAPVRATKLTLSR